MSQALKDTLSLPGRRGQGGGIKGKERSVSKIWKYHHAQKCHRAQLTEGMAIVCASWGARPGADPGSGLGRLRSDHNGPSVPPK